MMRQSIKADVTAVIPVYNGKNFLRFAVDSVLSQTVLPEHLIIIDDGSTDSSLDVIDGIESPIPITKIIQKNSGQSAARNRGVSLAETEFIAFLDQDDYWLPKHIEVLIEPLKKDPETGWTYSNLNSIRRNGDILLEDLLNYLPVHHPKTDLSVCLSEDMFILPSASIIRKSAFDMIGGFDERLSGYEDDDLFLRLFSAGWKNVYINRSLSAWRMYSDSTSYSETMLRSRRYYWEKLYSLYHDNPDKGEHYVRDYIAPRFFHYGLIEYWRGIIINDYKLCNESLIDMEKYIRFYNPGFMTKLKLYIKKFPLFCRFIFVMRNIFKLKKKND